MDGDGNVVVIELKRSRTPREVVAQLLDYGSWVRELEDADIAQIFGKFQQRYRAEAAAVSLDDAFRDKFGHELPEELNESDELLVVAAELDASTERIVNYLADEYGASVNAAFFRVFQDGGVEYLSRVWLMDPVEAEAHSVEKRHDDEWSEEFYVSFGDHATRRWEDGRKHGYIAAGGGTWYSRTLEMLAPGDRVWVNVPGKGYVGVGRVTAPAARIDEFTVPNGSGRERPIAEVVEHLPSPDEDEEKLEHFVRVEWVHTVPLEQAVREKGFFGNQNSVAKPKSRKWGHTVERLKQRFGAAFWGEGLGLGGRKARAIGELGRGNGRGRRCECNRRCIQLDIRPEGPRLAKPTAVREPGPGHRAKATGRDGLYLGRSSDFVITAHIWDAMAGAGPCAVNENASHRQRRGLAPATRRSSRRRSVTGRLRIPGVSTEILGCDSAYSMNRPSQRPGECWDSPDLSTAYGRF